MKRRSVLRNLLLISGGVVLLPACLEETTTGPDNFRSLINGGDRKKRLARLAGTIIPASDTPGAEELSVHEYVLRMLEDCYEKDTQVTFVTGLDQIELIAQKLFDKQFADLSATQREEMLMAIQDGEYPGEVQEFYKLMKNLTITGYLNSEYVMSNLLVHEMIPGRFYGCVPVKS